MIDLLILMLIPALKYTDGGSRNPLHMLAALAAYVLDLIIARTTFALIAGRGPQNGEHTVSQMLENLCVDKAHPDQILFISIAVKLNRETGYPDLKAIL